MALNVVNWSDKQLDELADLLQTGDFSSVSSFVCQNFLAQGSRILYGGVLAGTLQNIELTVTINVTDTKVVNISPGVFLHNLKISQLDSAQSVNILDSSTGTWGTGKIANAGLNRWSIICVKNAEQANTPEDRWFVDDSVDPNTYSKIQTNTLINKAYYEIVVVHGTDVAGTSYAASAPVVPSGYFVIAEIYVPAGATSVLIVDVYDTTDISNSTNWTSSTRIARLEFWSSLFGVDHDPTTGYHRSGGWHIGSTLIITTGVELNQALSGIGGTVTAPNLIQLTNGSLTTLHNHGGLQYQAPYRTLLTTSYCFSWQTIDISSYVSGTKNAAVVYWHFQGYDYPINDGLGNVYTEYFRKSVSGSVISFPLGYSYWSPAYGHFSAACTGGFGILELSSNIFQVQITSSNTEYSVSYGLYLIGTM